MNHLETLKQARDDVLSVADFAHKTDVVIGWAERIAANLTTAIEQLEKAEPVAIVKEGCNGYPWKTIGYLDEGWLAALDEGTKLSLYPTTPQHLETDQIKCRHCGQDTMHLGDICYSCAHPTAPVIDKSMLKRLVTQVFGEGYEIVVLREKNDG